MVNCYATCLCASDVNTHTLILMSDDPDKMPRFMISYLDLQCKQAVRRYA